ncbi:regulatory protein GemA [Sphaerotilus sp.]|uniref:regulatory protein GemA n=1 Tax=Sphaerotilus sp. TaxID=2093942 RepID=UPI00286DB547|nr:regulatory protein GemA [Sphaerotilus sp.]
MSNLPNARTRDLARIHVLKKALAWDDDLYRDVMAQVCGATSAATLDTAGRSKLLAHLQARKDVQDGKPARAAKPARKPLSDTGKKLWSLWMQAADKGLVKQRTMQALNTWIKRQTGVERVEWLTEKAQADLAIESLKQWVNRGGAV